VISAPRSVIALAAVATLFAACTSTSDASHSSAPANSTHATDRTSGPPSGTKRATEGAELPGKFTVSFAGDVHFSGRVRARLDRDPATAFAQAAAVLRRADLTMVNLETAVTTGGVQQSKAFTFRTPATAFTALRDAGVDVATMANNHGADYGLPGLHDTFAAIMRSHFPVIGVGPDAARAFAPYTTTLNGVRVAIIAADQVHDETTLPLFSAGPHKAGVANAYSPQLIRAVRHAKAEGYVVIVYLHWGIEYQTCPSGDQTSLANALAHAGASAVIGTHAHVLLGAGWLPNGTYVSYGLGNYLWWMSFGNNQDDNGVLTLTFKDAHVVANTFAPAHLDDRGVPLPATGAERQRILAEWKADRQCTDLSATPPH
jgi:poly-gamma-glutamate synthesis protein (capsule biosynthesis protein)